MGRICLHRRVLICALCASIVSLAAPTPSFAETVSFEVLPDETVVENKQQDDVAGSDRVGECITNETHEDDSAAGGSLPSEGEGLGQEAKASSDGADGQEQDCAVDSASASIGTMSAASRAGGVSFSDVSSATAHADDIAWLASEGITTGYRETVFKPTSSITRCDMAAFIRRVAVLAGDTEATTWSPSETDWSRFSDVNKSTPHAEDVLWLAHTGISTGFADRTFRPYASIARCDMAAFLVRLAARLGISDAGSWSPASSDRAVFHDVSTSTSHSESVLWLAHAGVSTGFPDGSFRPYSSIARCDTAAFLRRMVKLGGFSDASGWLPSSSDWVRFSDVSSSTPHASDILWMAHANLSTGFETYYFRPSGAVTRGDMAAFLRRIATNLGISDAADWVPASSDWAKFSDVTGSTDHAEDILWLAHAGITNGWGDGSFHPRDAVRRSDMAAFLKRLAVLAGDSQAKSWQASSANGRISFTDVGTSTGFYSEILWLAYSGISSGYSDGSFASQSSVARADMAAFLHRFDAMIARGGSVSTGWVKAGSAWRYIDCVSGTPAKGWQMLGGAWYYLDPASGDARTGWITVGGVPYDLGSDGRWVKFHSHNIAWAGQPNGYYCGPASGYMILRNVGATRSASGASLTVYNVASYMGTTTSGTNFATRAFANGMNRWLGKNIYTTVHTPSYATVRNAIMNSYRNGYASAVDTQERRGGPHLNGHSNSTFSHIMVVDSYNQDNDTATIVDPGAGTVWSGSAQKFSVNLNYLVTQFMQKEIFFDREHIGLHYAR